MSRSPEMGNQLGMRAWRLRSQLLRGETRVRPETVAKKSELQPIAIYKITAPKKAA